MRRLATALALAIAALGAPAAHAEDGVITLTGSTTAYVDVTLPYGMYSYRWVPRFEGSYAGYYVTKLDAKPGTSEALTVGALVSNAFAAPSGARAEMRLGSGPQPSYSPGRYRIWLIADGPAVVRIWAGNPAPELHLRPAKRVAVTSRFGPLPAGPVARRVPVTSPRPFLAVSALMLSGTASATADVDVCVAKPRGACPETALPYRGATVGDTLSDTKAWTVASLLPAGRYDAVQSAVTHVPPDRAIAGTFTMRLS